MMPSEFIHTFIGLQTLRQLNLLNRKNFKEIVLASQGPDVFLYAPFDKDVSIWGNLLHETHNANLFINHFGNILQEIHPAFAIAFASHYIADQILHPYINSRTNNPIKHGQLERAIDRAFMEFLGISPLSFKLSKYLPISTAYHIELAIKDAIKQLNVNEKYIVGYYHIAHKYMYIFHLFYDKAPFGVEISAKTLSKLGINNLCGSLKNVYFKDPLNIQRKPWKYKGQIYHQDVIRLINRAIETTIERGRAYLNGSTLSISITYNDIF